MKSTSSTLITATSLQDYLSKAISHEWLQWIIVTKLENGFDLKFTLILSQLNKIYAQVNLYLEYDINLQFKRHVYQSTVHVVDHAKHDASQLQAKINEVIFDIYNQAVICVDKLLATKSEK